MLVYVAKRLLLMIPTLVGILVVSFAIIQFVPGGPVEQLVRELRGGVGGGEVAATGGYRGAQGVDPQQVEAIRKMYGFDKPAHQRFVEMLRRYAVFEIGRAHV